jgi:hypothetical protein
MTSWRGNATGCCARILGQVRSGNELHHQKSSAGFAEVVADARQAGMMQLRQQTGFLLKLSPQTIVSRKSLFESYRRFQPLIDRFVDGAHAAGSQFSGYSVPALQNRAGT